ncbi:hypothetical protein [Sandaracinus amylolyticus]|uniref:hypothetical protein n=1 Tax=Sandaracinus amylolyticus TaxID=927083 RepID=UPI001F1C14B0|nr:hypothetical protein [Sandaracinus amylolyticus]UJR79998.1 Hypothetical protein I5071_20410 [Sandaracinus amylolyticus]
MSETLTDAELDEIERRCEAATGGPWTAFVEGRDHFGGSSIVRTAGEDIEMSGASEADYDFIAHARQDLPRLLAELRALRAASRSRSVRELGGEIWSELRRLPESDLRWDVNEAVVDIVIGVLARHVGSMLLNDADLPVEPLPPRE